jgi:hypothetical protein
MNSADTYGEREGGREGGIDAAKRLFTLLYEGA